MSIKNCTNDAICNRTLVLPACSAVAQPTEPPSASIYTTVCFNFTRIILPFSFIDVYFEVLFTCLKIPPKNKTSNVRYVPSNNITCSFKWSHLLGNSNTLIPFHWKTTLLWRFNFACINTLVLTYSAGYFFP